MQYLIDGYNFLFRLARSRKTFQQKRLEFIEWLNDISYSLKLNITVVFDSAEHFASRGHFDALEIIYTKKDLSADAYIIEKIHASPHPERITVVTSDRELAAKSRAFKALPLTVEAFMALLNKKRTKTKKKSPRPYRDSDPEIERLLRIFEKRLENLD